MLTRDDSLMEMSKTNQALCKQLALLLSRTEFDRTKESFLACYLCTVQDRRKQTLSNEMLFQVLSKDPSGSLGMKSRTVYTFTYTSEVHRLINCTQCEQTLPTETHTRCIN